MSATTSKSARVLLSVKEHGDLRAVANDIVAGYRSGKVDRDKVSEAWKVMGIGLALPKFLLATMNLDLRREALQLRKKK